MNKLRFSHYYHKLKHPLWCTVRPCTPEKQAYYERKTRKRFEVYVGDGPVPVGTATLLSAETVDGLDRLPLDFLDFDTTYAGGAYQLPKEGPLLLLFFLWEGGEVPEVLR